MRKPRFSKLEKFDTFISLSKPRINTVLPEILTRRQTLATEVKLQEKHAPTRPRNWVSLNAPALTPAQFTHHATNGSSSFVSRLSFDANNFDPSSRDHSVELHKEAKTVWEEGQKLWNELESGVLKIEPVNEPEKDRSESCPD